MAGVDIADVALADRLARSTTITLGQKIALTDAMAASINARPLPQPGKTWPHLPPGTMAKFDMRMNHPRFDPKDPDKNDGWCFFSTDAAIRASLMARRATVARKRLQQATKTKRELVGLLPK